MNKSEYNQLIEYAKDPYQGFLATKEHKAPELGITAAEALAEIEKEYFVLQSPYGEMDKDAPFWILDYIRTHDCQFLYGDEDTIVNGKQVDPFFKPDFSPELLEDMFYPGGLLLRKKSLPAEYEMGFGGNGSYDLKAQLIPENFERNARGMMQVFYAFPKEAIGHIPKVLFHNRQKVSYSYPNGSRFEFYQWKRTGEDKHLTVVILSKDNPEMLFTCIDSVIKNSDFPYDMKIVVVDNGSCEENRTQIAEELKKRDCVYHYEPQPFQYSTLCNIGATYCEEGYLLFLNDDVVVPDGTKGFPSSMYRVALRKHIGAVGIRLRYPNDTIQHVGIMQLKSGPSHLFATCPDTEKLGFGQNRVAYNCMAVTGACLMVSLAKFKEIGGFDERLHIAYTDVDLCMDLSRKGYYNAVVNDCFLYHHESVSRGREVLDEGKAKRLLEERTIFYEKNPEVKEYNRFYNPNLTKSRIDGTPEYDSPWDVLEMSSDLQDMVQGFDKVTECSSDKGIRMNIDRIGHIASSFENTENYREIEGWALVPGRDNVKYDPILILQDASGKIIPIKTVRKLRRELPAVFPKEKNIELSGFVIRIPDSIWNEIAPVRIGVGECGQNLFGSVEIRYRMSNNL